MSLHPVVGHSEVRQRLALALRTGKLPQVLALTGPAGIGKQRLALWLAQLSLCEAPVDEPCGRCRACRLVNELGHPDVHWFVPIPRPKATDSTKQVEEAAEAIAGVIDERRAKPLYGSVDGLSAHSIATVRLVQQRASLTAVEGRCRVFIIGEAERLVAQEGTDVAANALLKLLEEPPAGTLFVLTTTDVRRLLPTIRSRAVPIRLGRLTDADVRSFLATHLRPALPASELESRVMAAQGSIGAAVGVDADAGKAYQAANQLIDAVLAGPGARLERVIRQTPWAARGEFSAMLDALADTLGEAARGTLGQPTRRPVPERLLRHRSPDPLLKAIEHVADAREAAWGNVNPQLLLATLSEELAGVL
jgi:DNA polymerase-3 subunit delta'